MRAVVVMYKALDQRSNRVREVLAVHNSVSCLLVSCRCAAQADASARGGGLLLLALTLAGTTSWRSARVVARGRGGGGLLLEDLTTHWAASLRGLGAQPAGDAVKVETVATLTDDCQALACENGEWREGVLEVLTNGAVVAWVLALGASALEIDPTDAAGAVVALGEVPLPLGDGAVVLDRELHRGG